MTRPSTRLRLGAVALGACALLFASFPLVRPFFRRPTRECAHLVYGVEDTAP